VLGVGNRWRRDDGAGPEVARRVRDRAAAAVVVRELEDEPIALIDAWLGAGAVVVVDALRSGAAPGTIVRADASNEPLPAALRGCASTHAIGVADAIELARALGRLPARLVVFGVEGRSFEVGHGLSAQVAAVIDGLADRVLNEAYALARPTA
jgi:hydrogenase maturation protease